MDWFLADTHFGHKKILDFEKAYRPYKDIDEMNWQIVQNINALVKPSDVLYMLGDVAFSSQHDILDHIDADRIIIILGNHDYPEGVRRMIDKPGIKIAGSISYKGCILTHIPVHPCQLERYRANIHGHLHEHVIPDVRYYNVSLEQHDMRPVDWPSIARIIPNNKAGGSEAFYGKVSS